MSRRLATLAMASGGAAAGAAALDVDRVRAALWGMHIGDALAMPVHWYYNLDQLKRDFGSITKYEAPKEKLPGSIMSLSSTGGGGRGSDAGTIVGDVILHGKRKYLHEKVAEFLLKEGQARTAPELLASHYAF